MDKFINIVLASDDNFAQHAAVAMASVLINTKVPQKVRFYLIDDEIQDGNKEKITKTVENLGGSVEFIKIKNNGLEDCYVSVEISRASYFRIDIANILDESIEKIIYLDCDLLVYDDIEKMWQFDMKGKPVAAVCDFGVMASARRQKQKNHFIGLPFDAPYFNAGVLMMDLKQWRSGNFAESIIALAMQNKYPNHDQDALNKFFMNNWQEMPLRWNVIPPVFDLFLKVIVKPDFRKKAIEAKLDPAILHYAGRYKPWKYSLYKGFNDKYYEFLQSTEFKNEKMPIVSKHAKTKSIIMELIRLKRADLCVKIFG